MIYSFSFINDKFQFLPPQVYVADFNYEYFNVDEFRSPNPDENRPTIIIGEEIPTKHVVLHNSLPYEREELVNFYIARPFAMVMDSNGIPIACQFDPVLRWHKDTLHDNYHPQASNTKYRLSFKARLPPLGLRVYTIQATRSAENSHLANYAKITVHTDTPFSVDLGEYPHAVEFAAPQEISLHWEETGAGIAFNRNGLLKSMSLGEGQSSLPVHLEFLQYGVKRQQESSGAYLFMPDGPAQPMDTSRLTPAVVVVSRGDMESSVATGLSFGVHSMILRETGGVEVQNLVDVTKMLDTEVVMRINTQLQGDFFYTDLNGLQWIKRQRFEKLPIQANYYPIPSGIFIENETHRLTVLSGQSLGGSSLKPGQVEVMQDRRLQRDDNRGLGQGVMDNRKTLHVFRLLLESREGCTPLDPSHPSGFLTARAHSLSQALTYPMERLVFQGNEWSGMVAQFGEEREGVFGVDVAVLRHLPGVKGKKSQSAVGVVLHRSEFERCSSSNSELPEPVNEVRGGGENLLKNGYLLKTSLLQVNVRKLLGMEETREMFESHLNLVRKGAPMDSDTVQLCAMGMKGVIVPR